MEVVEEDGLPGQAAAPFNPLNPLTSLFRAAEEEEDEEDAPLPTAGLPGVAAAGGAAGAANGGVGGGIAGDDLQGGTTGVNGFVSSQDFTDAYAAVTSDPWDIYSWCIYLDEAERGHSGSITVEDAYGKFLTQFPRGYKFWNKEIQYFLQRNEFATCDALFNKCLAKCRYVDVWCTYIEMVKRKASVSDGTVVKTQSQITTEKQQLEAAYEKALETVGMSVNSGVIWRDYIDYIRNWPELGNNIEAGTELVWCHKIIMCISIMLYVHVCFWIGRRLLALRKLYQRALCVPTDGLDSFWREYEALERSAGEMLAERMLPEYNEKYLHAAAVYKDRIRYHTAIDFDRLAVPPSTQFHAVDEVRQLLAWDHLIKYERTNPDKMSAEQHRQYQLLVFDQFIACFRLHPEVWIELSKLEQQQTPPYIAEARNALKEGIELIPDVAMIRIALAEFEENQGAHEAARDVYRGAFEAIPSALTFTCFQRYVRRREGSYPFDLRVRCGD
jgi:cleavage stimulation factor subunit 3